ncbi:hypothetical protein M9Y10_024630 [Tritrichomonas musculus]|uniref:Uncharacterized protein n=1 Tax=Tritrichomonas musculus TaxID=1915356 RepID=A0ABR2HD56_9EUKA
MKDEYIRNTIFANVLIFQKTKKSSKYVKRDINKAIKYYSLAADQNYPEAQIDLGFIYYDGKYVPRDINKAIQYYSLAANQNHAIAQCYLGLIYFEGKYVTRDISKAISYFSLAANQNNQPEAQTILGAIYLECKDVPRNIDKSIYYLSLAANQNNEPGAQFTLGMIYFKGKYVARNINTAIHYLSLAAYKNYPHAQFNLGIIYYSGKFCAPNIKKGMFYIELASNNGHRIANFAHGFLLHEGKNIPRDIENAIHYYKEASSFNINYAKNNLGIIYKHGYGESAPKRLGSAIEYFEEAIRQGNDYLSMYNLAHIYIYEENINQDINKLIDLLIKSSEKFDPSFFLLCIILIKQNISYKDVIKNNDLAKKISRKIVEIGSKFEVIYDYLKDKDYIYNLFLQPVLTSELNNIKFNDANPKYPNAKDISNEFYDGFGRDLLI